MRRSTSAVSDRGAWVAGRDPRLRIIAAIAFALVTVSLQNPLAALGALAMAGSMAWAGGMRRGDLLRRLAALEGFMIIVLVTLPFTVPGTPLAELGPLSASREGLLAAVMIVLKANAVVLALLGLVGSLEPMALGSALTRLGVPRKLVHLMILTVRQIHLFDQEYKRLRRAMRARAFVPRSDRHTWRSYGYLMGMLLVRSVARGQRVLAAMRCRGFHGPLYLLDRNAWSRSDTGFAVGIMLVFLGLALADGLA